MTWNNPIAPEREVARGSPQDSICMITATRFGSSDDAFAQRTISFPQCWISLVKMGERPLEEVTRSDAKDQIGVTAPVSGNCPGTWPGNTLLMGGAAF